MTPYFTTPDGSITIYHGDCREVLPVLPMGCADLVLTDPPYSAQTHAGARTRNDDDPARLVTFNSMSFETISEVFNEISLIASRWVVTFMDWRHVGRIEAEPPIGMCFIRFGVWVKPNGAPQFTGDRPAQGWEGIAFLHRHGSPMRWRGGGKRAVYTYPTEPGEHPTGKPLPLVERLVEQFSDPQCLVVDPFMGSGTTLRAAMNLGRRAIGIEIEERYCEIAANRLSQQVLPLEVAS